MKNLRTFLISFVKDKITVEDFVTFDDNLTTSTDQINTDLIDWQQQAREEAIKEVVPNTSSARQAANVVLDGDEDDQEEITPRHLTTSEVLQHLDVLLHFSMIVIDAILTHLRESFQGKISQFRTNLYVVDTYLSIADTFSRSRCCPL